MNRQSKRNRGVILTSEGWQKLQKAKRNEECQAKSGSKYTLEEISERTGLTANTIAKVLSRQEAVDKRTLLHVFLAFNLELDASDYSKPEPNQAVPQRLNTPKRIDWGEAVDVSVFYGRASELSVLEKWLIKDRCRVVALLGMGGIGKTSLAAKLVHQVQDEFDCVIWRSLYNAPPLFDLLASVIQFFSNLPSSEIDLPTSVERRILRLIDFLRENRCLIVLDNAETILQSGAIVGCYREGYENYGQLLTRIGEVSHQSCLLLTSREKPKEVASNEGETLPVRSLKLSGLKAKEAQKIIAIKGISGSESELRTVAERYGGNALALRIVSTTIQDVFNGNITEFLKQNTAVFGDIRELLEQQFLRLLDIEREIMYLLAINREPMSLSDLHEEIAISSMPQKVLEALVSLVRRSLVEKSGALFTLQPVVMEYVTNRLVEQISEELLTENIQLFRRLALMKATAKDYVKEAQSRLILQQIINGLLTNFKSVIKAENLLIQTLESLRESALLEQGYIAGNILNMLCQLQTDLTGYDFSHLTIWQADLRNVTLHDVNFAYANLAQSVFAENFGGVLSVAFSPDGKLMATGDSNGNIRIYQVTSGQQILICKGHTNWVVSLSFSPDGSFIASGSTDYTVRLWEVSTGHCLKILREHSNDVWSVTFSPDGTLLASGSDDRTIRLWDVSTGRCVKILRGHTNWVLSVAFTPNGKALVSGSDDRTIRLWNISTGQCLNIFQGHLDGVRSIALGPDGKTLVSGSEDNTLKLWDLRTGKCLKTLQGHTDRVFSVAFNLKGDIVASGSHDQTVRIWSVATGECLRIFTGHTNWVFSVAFSSQDNILASGGYDRTVRLWSVNLGECLRTFQGYSNQVISVACSANGQMLASGSEDRRIRLWNLRTGECLKTFLGHSDWVSSLTFSPEGNTLVSCSGDKTIKLWNVNTGQVLRTLQGHRNRIWSVTLSSNGQMLASGSEDRTIKLWNASTGECLQTLLGHGAAVWAVAFSPQGTILASGAWDQTVKLWDVSSGECLRTFCGHTNWVWAVAFSPNGDILASGSVDHTVKLWDVSTGECIRTLQGHKSWVRSGAFSPDGKTLASSSHDHTVKLWDVSTGECLRTFYGHTSWVWSVAFCPDSQALVSGSEDETIKLWDIRTGECLKTLTAKKPYERMNVVGITGINDAALITLRALGAVD
ncbi:NB-ARC domain-containing protein [Scytonema sp. NUACC21]